MITLEDLKRMKFVPQLTKAEINKQRKAIKDKVERLSTTVTLL